jgi:hypothetical protein
MKPLRVTHTRIERDLEGLDASIDDAPGDGRRFVWLPDDYEITSATAQTCVDCGVIANDVRGIRGIKPRCGECRGKVCSEGTI